MKNSSDKKTVPVSPSKTDYGRYIALVKASFIAISVDVCLVILKFLLAMLTANSVLSADAFHSVGDLAVSITVLISIIVHQSFHDSPVAKRVEAFAAFLISIALIFGSLNMLWLVINDQLLLTDLAADIPLIIAFCGVSAILGVTLVVSRYKKRIGEKHNSIAFIAEGLHTYSDFLTSFGVWLTLLLGYFGIQVSKIMSFIIGIAVLQIGCRLFIKSARLINIRINPPSRLKNIVPPQTRYHFITINKKISLASGRISWFFTKMQNIPVNWILNQHRKAIASILFLIVLLYAGTGFYQVLPYQTGLEMRFGEVVTRNMPGLHYHLPKPAGRAVLVDTGAPIRLESGFRTNMVLTGREPDVYLWEFSHRDGRYRKIPDEAVTISGDENMVDANFLCYYRITNAETYALKNKATHEILRSLFTHKALAVLNHYKLDNLLTRDRDQVQQEILREIKTTVEKMPLGVVIEKVYMQEAHPPIAVIPQYRAVASAREEKINIIHQATAYSNDLLPRARGKAATIVLNAAAVAEEKKEEARGETNRFLMRQANFDQSKTVQKERLRWEAIENAIVDKPIYLFPSRARRRIYYSENK